MTELIEVKHNHITMNGYIRLLSEGYECEDLKPCAWQGRDGSCKDCPGIHKGWKKPTGCNWQFSNHGDTYSHLPIVFYKLEHISPDDINIMEML